MSNSIVEPNTLSIRRPNTNAYYTQGAASDEQLKQMDVIFEIYKYFLFIHM